MPAYRIFRMKDVARQQFRWAPHTSGVTGAKPKDYVESGTIEAASPYAAWFALRDTEHALEVGDVLEAPSSELRIYKYVGFEEARWVLPEARTLPESAPFNSGAQGGAEFHA